MGCVLSDMNAISRVDSYFTNYKMPWEQRDPKDIMFSVGLFEVYKVKVGEKFGFQKVFSASYGSQATCCVFNELLGIFIVGCDDGSLHIYKLDRNTPPFFKPEFEEKVHDKRVMGVAIDGLKGMIYSVGEDGYLQVLDFQHKRVVACELKSGLCYQSQTLQYIFHRRSEEIFYN